MPERRPYQSLGRRTDAGAQDERFEDAPEEVPFDQYTRRPWSERQQGTGSECAIPRTPPELRYNESLDRRESHPSITGAVSPRPLDHFAHWHKTPIQADMKYVEPSMRARTDMVSQPPVIGNTQRSNNFPGTPSLTGDKVPALLGQLSLLPRPLMHSSFHARPPTSASTTTISRIMDKPAPGIAPSIMATLVPTRVPSVAPSDYTQLTARGEVSRLTDFCIRPGYGTKGLEIEVIANYFAVRAMGGRAKPIYHYDIDINPVVKTINQKRPKGLLRAVWEQLCLEMEGDEVLGQSFGSSAFDGRRNVFTPFKVPITEESDSCKGTVKEFITAVGPDRVVQRAGKESSSDDESKRFKVAMKLVATIQLEAVMEYCRNSGAAPGNRYKGYTEEKSLTAIMATNVLLRDAPSKKYAQVGATGNRFFTLEGSAPLPQGGVVCRGFIQSLRHSSTGLPLLNLDIAASAFLGTGPAIEVITKILGRPGGGHGGPQYQGGYHGGIQRPFELTELTPREITIIKHKLRGAKFSVTHRHSTRLHTVMSVTLQPAEAITFSIQKGDGERERNISITEYYREYYASPVTKPRLPCIQYGKKAFIPLEFVNLVEWNSLPPPKLTAEQTAEMIKFSALRPPDRAEIVRRWRKELAYEKQQKIADWGLQVNSKMLQLNARILPPPRIVYARNLEAAVEGSGWRLTGKQFYKAGREPLKAWSVISFDKWFDIDDMKRYIIYLVEFLHKLGVQVENRQPYLISPTDPREILNVESAIKEAARMAYDGGKWGVNPQLICVVLPGRDAWLYESIKRISFTKLKAPVPTQCMQATKIKMDRGLQAYTGNLAMKIQSKLGGVTHQIPMSELPGMERGKTMLLGADLGHPPIKPGYDTAPTVACSIATFDADCSRFSAQIRLQEGRDQIVKDLSAMTQGHLQHFHEHNKCLPDRILIFRDGLSEGQYASALAHEHTAVIEACHRFQPGYRPKILICVCAKRHNTRFFAKDTQVDRSGNLPSGLVVDRSVTHPYTYDFFIQAHSCRIGTARPTHYIVLLDELGLSPDQLQQTVHSLCYGFARCTKSVSLVPVCYIADLVCQKARIVVHDPSRGTTIAPSESSAGRGKGASKMGLPSDIDVMQVQNLLAKNEELSDVMWWM